LSTNTRCKDGDKGILKRSYKNKIKQRAREEKDDAIDNDKKKKSTSSLLFKYARKFRKLKTLLFSEREHPIFIYNIIYFNIWVAPTLFMMKTKIKIKGNNFIFIKIIYISARF
jgi:hypothetical protein